MKDGWRQVRPCPKCGHDDPCKISEDGAVLMCLRVPEGAFKTVKGWNFHRLAESPRSDYVGKAHRAGQVKTGASVKGPKIHKTVEDVINAAAVACGGTFAKSWTYHNRDRAEHGRVLRFNLPGGDKVFRPIYPYKGGWKMGDPPGLWPLYRLPELAGDVFAVVCEGEKAADAATGLGLPGTTSAHGASAAEKTDWAPLAGKYALLFPDNDPAGRDYVLSVARILLALDPPCRVKIVELPGLPAGGDVVEWIEAGGTLDALHALVDAAPWLKPEEVIGGPVLRCLAEVKEEAIAWLWCERIALGKLSLIGGTPGVGKSWLSLFMAAAVSRGLAWPDGRGSAPLGSAIIANAEDGAADTLKPRLIAMGADCRRVHVLDCVKCPGADGKLIERGFTLADVADLERAIARVRDCRLIVIDPVSAYLADADEHRNGEVRALLKPISRLAEKHGCAVVCVTHLTKGGGANSVHRMIGSIGFAGAARSVWMVAKDKADANRRLMLLAKCNIAADVGGLAYSIVDGAIAFEPEPVTQSADDLLAQEIDGGDRPGPEPVKQTAAKDWLVNRLSGGPALVGDVKSPAPGTIRADVAEAGLSWATVRRAADELGIISERCAFTGRYQWRLPKVVAQDPEKGRT